MWEIVRAGGPLMWPIILCSIVAAAIMLERLWTLQDKRVLPQELPAQVWKLIENNQVNDKVIAALEQNSPLGKVLAAGLANRHRPRDPDGAPRGCGRHVVMSSNAISNTLGRSHRCHRFWVCWVQSPASFARSMPFRREAWVIPVLCQAVSPKR